MKPNYTRAMSTRDRIIWTAIQAVCWVIFIGYCIQTGALLFNYVFSLSRPIAAHNLYLELNLSDLYKQHQPLYTSALLLMIALSAGKAYIFYLSTTLFTTINLATPFSERIASIITKITSCTFLVGLVTLIAHALTERLLTRGYPMAGATRFWDDGAVYLTMSAILFVIALIFKKGIALQKENDLTI